MLLHSWSCHFTFGISQIYHFRLKFRERIFFENFGFIGWPLNLRHFGFLYSARFIVCSVSIKSELLLHLIVLVESMLVCKQMWELAEVSCLGWSKVSSPLLRLFWDQLWGPIKAGRRQRRAWGASLLTCPRPPVQAEWRPCWYQSIGDRHRFHLLWQFLAVHNSSIGDLVTHWVSH